MQYATRCLASNSFLLVLIDDKSGWHLAEAALRRSRASLFDPDICHLNAEV